MRICYLSVARHGVIRPRFAEKCFFIMLFPHFVLVHVIIRISNEFSFHTMYYETRQRLGEIKHTTRFIIHRMEWKFIWDHIWPCVRISFFIPESKCLTPSSFRIYNFLTDDFTQVFWYIPVILNSWFVSHVVLKYVLRNTKTFQHLAMKSSSVYMR